MSPPLFKVQFENFKHGKMRAVATSDHFQAKQYIQMNLRRDCACGTHALGKLTALLRPPKWCEEGSLPLPKNTTPLSAFLASSCGLWALHVPHVTATFSCKVSPLASALDPAGGHAADPRHRPALDALHVRPQVLNSGDAGACICRARTCNIIARNVFCSEKYPTNIQEYNTIA